jgi:hypothetical protein
MATTHQLTLPELMIVVMVGAWVAGELTSFAPSGRALAW